MPDERISELTTITTIDINNDPMVIVDSSEPDITKRTKKTFPAALKTALSLNNVDNTSDANKPVSTATQTALDGKQDNLTLTTTGTSGAATLVGDVLNIPQYSGGAGGAEWGDITGTLSDQADLQSALDAKQNSLGFTPENVANKSTDVNTDQASNTKYPSVKAVYDWVVGLFVQKNAAITGATKTKITYDAKGLVTGGADATTADIADSTDKRYVTDAQLTVIGNTSGTNSGDNAINSQYSGLAASKQDTLVSGTNIKTLEGQSLLGSGNIDLSKSDVGLGNVDNTSDANKPVSTATQTALDTKTNKLITTNRQTASYTLVLSDADKLVEMNVGSANNLTVPLNSSVAFSTGTQILLSQYGSGQTTIVATSGVTVRSNGGKLKLNVQYSGATLIKIGTDEWYLFGDIVA
jgi:hypothetical protein